MNRCSYNALAFLCTVSVISMSADHALSLTELEDGLLARVSAQGIAFNLEGFSLSGDLGLTYSGDSGESMTLEKWELSRTDHPSSTFDDPYRLSIDTENLVGQPVEALRLQEPYNTDGSLVWNLAADWSNTSASGDFDGGAIVIDGLRSYAGQFNVAPSLSADSSFINFGIASEVAVDEFSFRPNGRLYRDGQLSIEGIYFGGANGNLWELASLENQPGTLRIASSGEDSWLELAIDWPKNGQSDSGAIRVDGINVLDLLAPNLANLLPAGVTLGASLQGIELQYLNVRLH